MLDQAISMIPVTAVLVLIYVFIPRWMWMWANSTTAYGEVIRKANGLKERDIRTEKIPGEKTRLFVVVYHKFKGLGWIETSRFKQILTNPNMSYCSSRSDAK